ncbi:MAG: homoserine dehydrogenase [Leptospiraceae bacterium]|nr:homoserine dehydrogenase [Leptospiraceae bacterium]MCK6381505.1 homoserine dehydrogenase [Leptospiraceae bacterium]NUM41123.1 homoserine dehydrogenase [Leptospiraceae bacterium]
MFNVALVGGGTVGSGLISILEKRKKLIQDRSGIELNLALICDKDTEKIKKLTSIPVTDNFEDVLSKKDIDIVVELIGGTTIAYEIVKKSLLSKKTVITANKALIAEKGEELFQLASDNGVEIGYEASVGGAIPVIRTVKTGLVSNQFESVYGILNGTTNFILSKMEEDNLEYSDALKKAQELGFAEKDPTFDVEGIDAAQKLSILGGLVFDRKIPSSKIFTKGISKITKTEILFAKQLGYRIKLLGICRKHGDLIEARVHPAMIPLSHPIANVMNEMNAVYFHSEFSGPTILMGKGAGSLPTASAVVSDLVFYSSRIGKDKNSLEKNLFSPAEMMNPEESVLKFYLRFNTVDKPGVLGHITDVLGNNNISISTVRQNESNKEPIEVIVITHKSKERDILKSLKEIDEMTDIIKEKTILVRLQESL